MDSGSGATDIPSLTPAAEHLSTLTTLKEVREKWASSRGVILPTTITPTEGLFGRGLGKATRYAPRMIKKRIASTPLM